MAKKKINSRRKGASGEREAAKYLSDFGVNARRGVQFKGGVESPDVVHDIPGWHLEVKRTECLSLYSAMDQATHDAETLTPCVLHRRNKKPWVAIVPAEAWINLVLLERSLRETLGADAGLPLSALRQLAEKRLNSGNEERTSVQSA